MQKFSKHSGWRYLGDAKSAIKTLRSSEAIHIRRGETIENTELDFNSVLNYELQIQL